MSNLSELSRLHQNNNILTINATMQEALDLREFSHLHTRVEELQDYRETLNTELEKAGQDKEELKPCIIITYCRLYLDLENQYVRSERCRVCSVTSPK